MADNTVTLVGNLTRDPELKFTASGQAIARLGLAVNRRYQVNGEWKDDTSYFDVTAWGQLGENASATFTKGARVIVTGRLRWREYTTREGDKRTAVEVVADELGPSLRWATAQVDRNPRTDGQSGGAPRGGNRVSFGDESNPFDGEEPF